MFVHNSHHPFEQIYFVYGLKKNLSIESLSIKFLSVDLSQSNVSQFEKTVGLC